MGQFMGVSGAGLVVNGIEGGDKVKSARLGLLVELAEVASNKACVLVASLFGFHAGEFNGLFREIDSDEPAIGKPGSQEVQRPVPPAADVQNADAVLKPLIEARNQRQTVAF